MGVWRWLTAAVVWLLAVAVVAAVAWFAVDSAGREVAGADDGLTLVSAARPSPALATTPANVTPTPSPSPTALGAPGPESGTDRSGIDMVTPSGTPSVAPSGGVRAGTYSSAGGVVLLRCSGGSPAGSALRAADGWRVEASTAGAALRVLFVAGDGRVAGVEAACRNGQPSFSPAR